MHFTTNVLINHEKIFIHYDYVSSGTPPQPTVSRPFVSARASSWDGYCLSFNVADIHRSTRIAEGDYFEYLGMSTDISQDIYSVRRHLRFPGMPRGVSVSNKAGKYDFEEAEFPQSLSGGDTHGDFVAVGLYRV